MILGVYRWLDPAHSSSPEKYKNCLPFVCVSPDSEMELHSEDRLFVFANPNVLQDMSTEFELIHTMKSNSEEDDVLNPLSRVGNSFSSLRKNQPPGGASTYTRSSIVPFSNAFEVGAN